MKMHSNGKPSTFSLYQILELVERAEIATWQPRTQSNTKLGTVCPEVPSSSTGLRFGIKHFFKTTTPYVLEDHSYISNPRTEWVVKP